MTPQMRATSWAALTATVAMACAVALLPTPASAQTRDDQAPFCIQQYGPSGPSAVYGTCRYYNYQQCLQAAVGTRGNCIPNVDYRGTGRARWS